MPSFNTGPDKEAFLRYLDDFHAVADPEQLLDELRDCVEPLPLRQVESLGLPVGPRIGMRCGCYWVLGLPPELMECPNDSTRRWRHSWQLC